MNGGKERLVVEVVAAHNLMPKDGEGSSSAFVEVEFENQRQRTQVKHRDLNPVWNEKLVFHVNDVADLPYRSVEVNVFNERRSTNSRNFLGRVCVSGSSVPREGEEATPTQLYTLEKRSLFSHVRGEISLKLYLSTKESKPVLNGGGGEGVVSFNVTPNGKKSKKMQQAAAGTNMVVQLGGQDNNKLMNPQNQSLSKPVDPTPGDIKPVVIAAVPGPTIPAVGVGGGAAGMAGMGVYSGGAAQNEYSLKETSPHLGGLNKDKTSSTYDLVEQMQYLYVRVVKAQNFHLFGGGDIVAEVKLGNYRGITKRVPTTANAEWDQVFAFSKDSIQSSFVEIFVRETNKDDFLGRVWFDLNEVPKRLPPDSQLAPQWYRTEDKKGDKSKGGEIMVSTWFGTQADEAFAEAWHSKAANVAFDGLGSIKSKVYLSPKLWYLRVGVIEAQDIILGEKGSSIMRYPELFVKVQVGSQVLRTRVSVPAANRTLSNPFWNEDLMFVVAEPFEDLVLISVEDHVASNRDEVVGRLFFPVSCVERRLNEKPLAPKWFNLDLHFNNNPNDQSKAVRFASRIHLRASLDGGYHVLDEATMYSSDVRPTAKQLWKPHIGVLEVGFLGATNVVPMKMKQGKGGSTDAYCVAKYGQKWVRTRTVVDSMAPKWNEQYTWEVFDPCTVITIGVFDNSRVDKNMAGAPGSSPRDPRIGKVRIRLSTLETDRVYTNAYPLLMLHPSGVKKMGELHLAVRFSCSNMVNMLHMYTIPLLPKMHYVQPLSVNQLDSLRYQAMNVVAGRMSRAEPPLGREVVEYMLDHDSHMWSMRKSKANFFRLRGILAWGFNISRLLESLRNWNKPVNSTLFLITFFVLVIIPELIIPFVFLTMAVTGVWRYRSRPRLPPHMDTRLSYAENVHPDELDEEFDSFPSSRNAEVVRLRYDRLRSVAGRIQTVVGDMATQGERFQSLLSWRDPRATFLFVMFCFVAAFGFYMVPIRLVVALWGIYLLRPPKFRNRLPSPTVSFFKRLPTRADSLL
ncbi:PREDICTED: FT-interacting protein 1 [Ipomoea nil]|uniref:FT-interacting protein 1 n=1 Tax=Ipomoea nil TaxID=35883 RepID=UPI000901DACF|nr:PREDICTED: FT-interacting protein 1 [Ipomoea nil]